ncbi:hypothetical protein AAMO2058_000560700 [Amorphochlora amoebiformis]
MEDCMFGISDGTEPKNWEEARHHPAWVKATDEEIEALEKNGTWKIIARRPEMRVVGVRTLYKQKLNKDGEPGRKKARVVAKGYTQYGVSFNDRYAPTLRIASLRAILALAQVKGRKILSADINNAYLHGPEDDEVYMEIPGRLWDIYVGIHTNRSTVSGWAYQGCERGYTLQAGGSISGHGSACGSNQERSKGRRWQERRVEGEC